MTKQAIKYVGFYDVKDSKSDRVSNLAAINKMNYISDVLVEAGYDVEFVSPSWMGMNTRIKFEKQKTITINNNKQVVFTPSWGTKNKFTNYFKIVFSMLWLFFYLIINVKKEEKIIAYHVQWISLPIRAAKMIKRFNLILEIEEVYGDVWDNSKLLNKWEEKLIKSADEYLYVSDLLREKFQDSNKNGVVVYGSYHVKKERLHNNKPIDSNIKLVYAGSIDDTKGGAYNAVETMKYLPANYSLSILGHGDDNSINLLIEMINSLNNLKGKTVCTYEGTKYGDEYSNFLSNCDVALNPQHQGHYMGTAFPSKIISYLAHNLRVVTTDIKSVRMSEVANLLYFANDDNPKNIARAIINIDFKQEYNSSNLILNMHDNLVLKFKKMLEKNEKSS